MGVCWGYIRENTNNVAKLKRLLAGLTLAINKGWLPIVLKGESQLILQMVCKLLHGKPISKVVDNWKMDHTLEHVGDLLRVHSEAQIHHIKRKANKLVDLLENYEIRKNVNCIIRCGSPRWRNP